MNTLVTVARRIFFFGALGVAVLGVCQKIASTFDYTLWRGLPDQSRLIEITAIALLFTIVLQLHEIRISLKSKSQGPTN